MAGKDSGVPGSLAAMDIDGVVRGGGALPGAVECGADGRSEDDAYSGSGGLAGVARDVSGFKAACRSYAGGAAGELSSGAGADGHWMAAPSSVDPGGMPYGAIGGAD